MSWPATITFRLGANAAGLTPSAALVNPDGTLSATAVAATIVEQGGGAYTATYAYADGFRGSLALYNGSAGALTTAKQLAAATYPYLQSGTFTAADEAGAKTGGLGGYVTGDALNNVHGLQFRSVSDGSTVGTSTYAGTDTPGTTTLLANVSSLATAVANLNNLSALELLNVPPVLEVPATGTIVYPVTVTVRDSEGHLADLTAVPAVTVVNAAGTDRSAKLGAVTRSAVGRYSTSYTVSAGDAQEGLTFAATGTAAADSTPRYANATSAVVAVDQGTTLAAIKAKTDQLTFGTTNRLDATTTNAVTLAAGQNVTVTGNVTVGAYATGQDPATKINAAGGIQATVIGTATGAIKATSFDAGGLTAIAGAVWSDATTYNTSSKGASLTGLFSTVTIDHDAVYKFTAPALANVNTSGGSVVLGEVPYALTFQTSTGSPVASVPYTVDTGTTFRSSTSNASGGTTGFYAPATGSFTVAASQVGLVVFPSVGVTANASGGAVVVTGAAVALPVQAGPGETICYFQALDNGETSLPGSVWTFALIAPPGVGTAGRLHARHALVQPQADATNAVVFASLPVGATYELWSGTGPRPPKPATFKVPAVGPYAIPEALA